MKESNLPPETNFAEEARNEHLKAELLRLNSGQEGCGCSLCQELYKTLDLSRYGDRIKKFGDFIYVAEAPPAPYIDPEKAQRKLEKQVASIMLKKLLDQKVVKRCASCKRILDTEINFEPYHSSRRQICNDCLNGKNIDLNEDLTHVIKRLASGEELEDILSQGGRPKKYLPVEEIKQMAKKGIGYRGITRRLKDKGINVGRTTVQSVLSGSRT